MAVAAIRKSGTLTMAVGAFAVVILIILWSAAMALVRDDRIRTLEAVDKNNSNLAHTLAAQATRTFDYADRILIEIKSQYERAPRDIDLQRFASESGIDNKLVMSFLITDARGQIIRHSDPKARLVNLADREHFQVHVGADSGRPFISRPILARSVGGRPAIVLTRRLNRSDGAFDGMVAVAIDPDAFTAGYRAIGLSKYGLIAMTGLDGFVRARSSGDNENVGQYVRKGPLFAAFSARNEGTLRYTSLLEGLDRRVAFSRLEKYPLAMSVGVVEPVVLADFESRAYTIYTGATLASLLIVLSAGSLLVMVRRREADRARLAENESRYRRLVENTPDATFINRGETVLYANPAALRLLGATTPEQVIGASIYQYIHPDNRVAVEAWMQKVAAGEGGGVLNERKYRRFDGSVIDVEVSTAMFELADGPARQVVARDITARKDAAEVLNESLERYRRMVEAFPDATFINREDRIVYANPAALRLLGATDAAQVVGKSPLDITHPDDRAAAGERINKMRAGEEAEGLFEQRFVRFDGSVVTTEVSASLVVEQGGLSRQVVARDITARKQAEAALRESESRYRRLVEDSPYATLISRGGLILYANPATLTLLGATDEAQVIGQSVKRFVHPDFHETTQKRLDTLDTDPSYTGAGLFERKYVRLDGVEIDVEISGVTVQLADGAARHIVIRDISERKKFEAALRDSESRYRTLVELAPDAIIIYEEEKVAFVNPAAISLLGAASADELIGLTLFDLIDPSGHSAAVARREFVLKTGEPTGLFEQVYLRRDGEKVEVEGSSILLPGGRRQRQVVLRDVSARKRAEAALRESEARLHIAVDAASLTYWEWDIASDIVHWGVGHEKLLGPLPPGKNRYPDFRTMVHADDRTRYLAIGRATMAHGVPYDVEFRLVRTDGAVRWMRTTGRALRDEDGKIEGMAGVMQDVTRRHAGETELAVSRQRRDALMDSIPAPCWLKGRDGRFIAVNRAWYERYGMDPGFAIGRTNSEVFPGPAAAERDREDEVVFTTGKEQRVERRSRVDGMSDGWFETVKSPVFDEHGNVTGIIGVSYDITERRNTELQLRTSEERFRQFADSVDDVFWIIDAATQRFLYVNAAFTQIFGISREELEQNPRLWPDAIHPDDKAASVRAFQHWLSGSVEDVFADEYRVVSRSGQVHWIRDHGTKLRDADGRVVRLQGVAEDITARREAEAALAESQQGRDALLESNPEPSWLKDCDGKYIAANRAWYARRRRGTFNVAGMTDAELFGAERAEQILAEDRRVIAERRVERSERNWHEIDGTAWIETVKAPVLDASGRVIAVIGVSHDISQRKQSEEALQRLNQSLEEKTAEQMALNRELEAFAYTVSHDLRAPLRHIDGFITLLKLHAGPTFDAQSTRYFERVTHAATRMGLLIDDLLAFSRTGRAELRMQRISLDRLIGESIEHLAPDVRGRAIEWKIGALPEVQGDAGLLMIVFQNLLGNAVKYTRPRAAAVIEVAASAADGMVTISVRDNGVGFDMKYQNKLFGVFQRLHTDAEFEGTGIGLATVGRIVQRHGGRVWAEGAEGSGACFYVELPATYTGNAGSQ
jgi:PAS domain S-box-containing protein